MSIASGFYEHYSLIKPEQWVWPNFTPWEVRCGIGPDADLYRHDPAYGIDSVFIVPEAMDALQRARTDWGRPFVITSAFRTPEYNATPEVGGKANSYHPKGKAFDIKRLNYDLQALVACLRAAGFGGIGTYNTFVHGDIGKKRSWDKRTL